MLREALRRWIVERRLSAPAQASLAFVALAVAVGLRLAMERLVGGALPFLPFFPLILVVAVLVGRVGALTILVGGVALSAMFTPQIGHLSHMGSRALAAGSLTVFGGGIAYVALLLREALRDADSRREQEHLLLLEIQHRVKNTLTVVQSLVTQTMPKESGPALAKLTDRLVALGQVHNLLSDEGWRPVSIRALADGALRPFRPAKAERITLAGEDLWLDADTAVNIALALHELATNAVKYGALSDDVGRVELWWALTPGGAGGVLRISWTERGGPPVLQPTRIGFGSRLLERGFGHHRGGEAALYFQPEGVHWSAAVPLSSPPNRRDDAGPPNSSAKAPAMPPSPVGAGAAVADQGLRR